MKRLVLCFILWAACFTFFSYKMGFSIFDSLNCVIGVAFVTVLILIPFTRFKNGNVNVERNKIHKDDKKEK
jgi:hypothetical protein